MHAAILVALVSLAACASLPVRSECAPPLADSVRLPLTGLQGVYRLTFVATEGSARGKISQGTLRFWVRPSGQTVQPPFGKVINLAETEPFFGSTDLNLARVGAGTEGETNTREPHPGAVLRVQRDENGGATVQLDLGSNRNRHDQITLDGWYTDAVVLQITSSGLNGLWEAGAGPTDYRAAGHFCAVRTSPA